MKKFLLIASIAGLAMASCKKERVCECTTTYTSSSGTVTTGTPSTTTYKKIRKSHAKDRCISVLTESKELTPDPSTYKTDTKCELK